MTASLATPVSAATPTPALRRFAWGVLAYNIGVILWGGVVRATGSGAGCGAHWPLCNGTVVQHAPQIATLIEYLHRATSGLAGLFMLALLVWTWMGTPKGHLARTAVVSAFVFTILEAWLGAQLVLTGMVAHDQSPARALYLSVHLANTLLLLGALTLTAHFLARKTAFLRTEVRLSSLWLASLGLILTLLVGVSGSIAALGDTLFPPASFRSALQQDFAANAWILRLRWIHPTLACGAGIFLFWMLYRAVTKGRLQQNGILTSSIAGLLALQYGLGVADVLLLAPTWMQIVHLLGADLLWITLVVLAARLTVTE